MLVTSNKRDVVDALNESPSEKEGKYSCGRMSMSGLLRPQ